MMRICARMESACVKPFRDKALGPVRPLMWLLMAYRRVCSPDRLWKCGELAACAGGSPYA